MLSVVDRIWAGGGRLAGLVDRNDVSSTIQLPFSSFVFIDILLLVVSLFTCLCVNIQDLSLILHCVSETYG